MKNKWNITPISPKGDLKIQKANFYSALLAPFRDLGGNTLKFSVFLFLLMVGFLSFAQNELDRSLQIAAENNAQLKMQFNEYMAALERAPQVKALPNPQVAFAYFIQPVETRVGPQQFKFSASQMFPWFGTLKAKENAAVQQAKARYEIFLDGKSKLFKEVRSTYYLLYYNQQAIDITEEHIQLLNTFKKLVNVKIETGATSALDQYRVEMELGDLENQLALLADVKQVLNTEFRNLLNEKDDSIEFRFTTLPENQLEATKVQLQDSILSNNHQLLMLSLQQDALAYRKAVAQNQGKPSFSLGLDYTLVGKGNNNLAGTDAFILPKVGISIPLYRSKYNAMVNEVMYAQKAKSFEQEEKENTLEVVFEKAWKDFLDATRRINLYQLQTDLASESLKLLETNYSTGKVSFEEIIRMDRKLLKYKLEQQEALTDQQAAIAFVYYLMGR